MIKNLLITLLLFTSLEAKQKSYQNEIDHLLLYVQTTECSYVRNGDAHDGKDAKKHIQRKYDYFYDDIESTEDFIRLSATKSTMSGSKYYIVCPNKPKIESSKWLLDELHKYRKTHKSKQGK